MNVRNDIERIIKEFSLDRNNIFEVSKQTYAAITDKIRAIFIKDSGPIHWSNINGSIKDSEHICISGNELWYHNLLNCVDNNELMYVQFEDTKAYEPKYWLYEIKVRELITVLDESSWLSDYYIVSKKFNWLISENHEEHICFSGQGINLKKLTKSV